MILAPMKALLFLLMVTVALGAEANIPSTTLTLKNGKVFRNVKITSQTDDAIYVRYNAGMVKIFKADLSAEMQKKYPTPLQRQSQPSKSPSVTWDQTNAFSDTIATEAAPSGSATRSCTKRMPGIFSRSPPP